MKIVVTGSLGNISKPLATNLLEKGHTVTIISSDPGKQTAIELIGATAAIGSVEDPVFLAGAFAEANAVYAMVPPDGREADQPAYYRRVGRSYARAIQQAGVRRVVHLSNWGASLALQAGNLPSNFLGTHAVEELLAELPGLALTHLRPTFFFTNYYWFSGMIREAGFLGANCSGSRRVPFVHPRDIAAAAAQELTAADQVGRAVRYVASDERSFDEVVRVVGAALGRPDLRWVIFLDEQMRQRLRQSSLPGTMADDVVNLYRALGTGRLEEDYQRQQPALGAVKLEDFAQEFAATFQPSSQ